MGQAVFYQLTAPSRATLLLITPPDDIPAISLSFCAIVCRLMLPLKLRRGTIRPTPAICMLKFTLPAWYSRETNVDAKLHA